MIELCDVWRQHSSAGHEVAALAGVSFEIANGSLCAVVGPSGSGKSTLLNILGLLDRPTRGEYFFNGLATGKLDNAARARIRNRSIGFVFQHFRLLPWLSVLDNVCLPAVFSHGKDRQLRESAQMWLERVGLVHRLTHLPQQLSGGEQQRVALARALITRPALLLADEPTGALDSATGAKVLQLMLELQQESGATVIVITHDEVLAKRCPLRVRMRDGIIERLERDC